VTAAATRRVLRRQGMPRQEIRAVLAANDPLLARRLLELHRERLGEWLEEQRGLVARIERSLAGELGPARSEEMRGLAARWAPAAGPHGCLGWGTR
jgi:DNA-binding transcriptional MerR regulator